MDVETLVNGWFKAQCLQPFEAYYLYFKPSAGKTPGELRILTEPEDGFQLADPRRISTAWTTQQAVRFVRDAMRSLPILATL